MSAAKKKATEPTALDRYEALFAELEHVEELADADMAEDHAIRSVECPGRADTPYRGLLKPEATEQALEAARVALIRGLGTQADVDALIAKRAELLEAIQELEERKAARARARKAIMQDIEVLVEEHLAEFLELGRRLSADAESALAEVIGDDRIIKAHQKWSEAASFWRTLERTHDGALHRDFVSFDTSIQACPLPDQDAVARASAVPRAVRVAAESGNLAHLGNGRMLTFRHHEGLTVDVAAGENEALRLSADPEWTFVTVTAPQWSRELRQRKISGA